MRLDTEKRTRMIYSYIEPTLFKVLENLAFEHDLTLSSYIRYFVLKELQQSKQISTEDLAHIAVGADFELAS